MSEAEKLAYFTEYTNKLKEKAIQDSIAAAENPPGDVIANNEFFKGNKNQGGRGEKEGITTSRPRNSTSTTIHYRGLRATGVPKKMG